MLQIHPNARTTPAVRAEIARSGEATGVLARRYGVSTETVRKWRKRGPKDCLDHSARPHRLPWKATEEERAVVCALRRATNFALDDLTFVAAHFLPHLNRDSVWRILRAEGLSRRPPPSSDRPKRGQGRFRDYDLGFVHIDIKHLPKLQTADGERRTTLGEWAQRVRRLATVLDTLDVSADGRVGTFCWNSDRHLEFNVPIRAGDNADLSQDVAAIMSAACPPPVATESPVNAAPAARISMAATSPVRTAVGRLGEAGFFSGAGSVGCFAANRSG